MATDHDDTDLEPLHASSSTGHVLTELQLFGHRPFQDEPDPRPFPAADAVGGAVADIFDALVATLSTRVSNPTSKISSGQRSISSTAPRTA